MRLLILVSGAALALVACSGGADSEAANNDATLQVDNLVVNGPVGADALNQSGNLAVDGNTQEMMNRDANTNDPDTNLANGI